MARKTKNLRYQKTETKVHPWGTTSKTIKYNQGDLYRPKRAFRKRDK